MRANCVGCDGLTFMRFDHEKGALFPFWMIYANDRRDPDAGVPNRRILDINRADPFAPGLDYIFRAVGQPEKAEASDRNDVPGVERSEERRGGKECVSTCRSRGSPYH